MKIYFSIGTYAFFIQNYLWSGVQYIWFSLDEIELNSEKREKRTDTSFGPALAETIGTVKDVCEYQY